MAASHVLRIIVYVCRAIQIPIAIVALGLTASLIPTFRDLDATCINELEGIECRRIAETLGGLRFSISTCVIALVDIALGLASNCTSAIPTWLVITLDSVTAGFFLGSGSTIAARLNGELCAAGPTDDRFACGRMFADMGFMFTGAIVCYGLVACFWTSRAKRCRNCDAEVSDNEGHALENPFQDPANVANGTAPESSHRGLSKRTSWSAR